MFLSIQSRGQAINLYLMIATSIIYPHSIPPEALLLYYIIL